MNKLMKKKVNVFGKEFSVFAIAVVSMMVLASAALVPYISNSVGAGVNVDSPIAMYISTDNSTWGIWVDLDNMVGGENTTFYTKIVNNLNKSIDNKPFNVTITNDNGDATCEDFTNFTLDGVSEAPVLDSNCFEDNGTVIIPGGESLDAGETDYDSVGFEFALNVKPSGYEISTQIMN